MARTGCCGWRGGATAILLVVVVVAAFTTDAGAAAGWLTGATVGQTSIGDYELEAEADQLDDTDFGWRVFGGYQVSYFTAVFGYVDLGSLKASGDDFGGFTDEISAEGFEIMGLGLLPLGQRVHLLGSVGMLRWNQSVTYADSFESGTWKASGISPSFGAGVDVMLNKTGNLVLHVEYTRYLGVGDLEETGHENDRDLLGTGIVWRFGL